MALTLEKSKLSKNELRKAALIKREALARIGLMDNISKKITDKIKNSLEFKNAKNIALYFPIKNEVDLTSLLDIQNKNFYLPRCAQNNLEFVKYQDKEHILKGAFNIPEPVGAEINPFDLDLIYIPALAANKKCFRLGYGKGFYDRFFKNNKIPAKKIIVVPKVFVSDEFVEEDFDFRCDFVLSEA